MRRNARLNLAFLRKTAYPLVLLLAASSLSLCMGCDPLLVEGEPVPGKACKYYFPSSADGLMIPSTVYLPKGYDPGRAYPMLVELHAMNGTPVITNNDALPPSVELKKICDENGWICLAPWGRNMHGMYVDGIAKEGPPYNEPNLYDDFSQGAGSWQAVSGTWTAAGGSYRQSDTSKTWKESVRLGSTGKDYCVRVKVKDLSAAGTDSGFAVNLRRDVAGGDAYRVEFLRSAAGAKSIRLLKLAGGVETEVYKGSYAWSNAYGDDKVHVRFSCYDDYLELAVNDNTVNLNLNPVYYNIYGFGIDSPGDPIPGGEVSLASYGGTHEFDEVRVQNDYQYGERDIVDCIYAAMEKYRIDPSRIYLMGHSMGGSGTWVIGLRHPDLFAAERPADGFTDIYYDYCWAKEHYPPNPGPPYMSINDLRIVEYLENLAGGPVSDATPERMSVLNGSSARYILENAVNDFWRIVHGTPDNNVPNSHDPIVVEWWVPFLFWFSLAPAPAPYSPATPAYANGKDIYDILTAWSARGGYASAYVTDPKIGHGFIEPYADTANYFKDKSTSRNPAEVAFKTYDGVSTGAWWLRLQIPRPGMNEPGMARVIADTANNRAAVHARNLARLRLDLKWMGLDSGAGKTVSFTLDDDTSPNVFAIADTTRAVTLELVSDWTGLSGYTVRYDDALLVPGSDYTIEGNSMVIRDLATPGGHTLTIQSPDTLPANLAPDPGAETAGSHWAGEVQNGGTAAFAWDDLEAHGGARSLRVKGGNLTSAGSRPVWRSEAFEVAAGRQYLLSAFSKARMFRGGDMGLGVIWYDGQGRIIDTAWFDTPHGQDYALNRDWTPVFVTARAPAGSARAAIIAGYEGDAAGKAQGSVWFDDFSFTPL